MATILKIEITMIIGCQQILVFSQSNVTVFHAHHIFQHSFVIFRQLVREFDYLGGGNILKGLQRKGLGPWAMKMGPWALAL